MYLRYMIKVVLIGDGNVAVHLAKAFSKSSFIQFLQRFSRNNKNDPYFNNSIPKTNIIAHIVKADIYVIAISDDSINQFSKDLNFTHGLVVHTSGSMPLSALQCNSNKGVLYPLQTFSKEQSLDFKNIPIAIEAENEPDYNLLEKLANNLSQFTYRIDTDQRKKLHVAAVFANNFSNHMFQIAEEICHENNFSFSILKPLILETANKIGNLSPEIAQTGPAKRNDQKVIKNHLDQLKNNQKEIYKLVTESIIKKYNS